MGHGPFSSNVHSRDALRSHRARGLVWSMLDALGAFDPGSNPGGPTIILLC